ncbi:MAG: alpha-amylase [Parcubacteria group bacterium CG10_big_fil_rev_8_21_14_0_10_38_31]|nr:MAG: alpha-amylase [Parcubacteria group bacterium CG10_big_fil_rev_8_21_14_0_10_38_31]
MPAVCLYFQVHQPRRIKKYRVFDIGKDSNYFNDDSESDLNNRRILEKVANKCYLPTNKIMLELLEKHPEFKITYSISGIALEQMEEFYPEVLKSFQDLTMTGRVEILSETYYHSLAFVRSKEEFRKQVSMHRDKVRRLFYQDPRVFRNTELIYNNELAKELESMGYEGVLAEGADHVLDWRSPNFVYKPVGTERIKLFLKNYKLSDDIAFRFSSRDWSEYPLDAPKFASWVSSVNGAGEVVNLFMDYETFGEHQWEDTGIFDFLRAMPGEILKHPDNSFVTPSEMVHKFNHVAELDVPHFVSWADVERDLSAWLSNPMQYDALNKLYDIEADVLKTMDKDIIEDWRRMQTSDHFYYMCTKWFSDGDVHKYFNPYETPYDAFISFMNAFNDLKLRVRDKNKKWSII